MAPPSSAHVQLDDDPRAPIQQSFGDEFHQHDGVVTMMMFYRRRASPKLRDDMTEVEYGGGGHRTRLRNDHEDQLVCIGVPPAPVYKGARGEEAGPRRGRAKCGVLLGLQVLVGVHQEGRKGEGSGERRKGAPPLPSPIRTSPWGGVRPPFGVFPSFPVWPIKAQYVFP